MATEAATHGLGLEDIAWVRALARRLASDEHLAEDVAQDTLAAAWACVQRGETPGRPWLVTVTRNFLRQLLRSGRARSEHEPQAARAEALPPVDAALAELEAHQRLMREVARLDEPLRTVLVLRFVDGRTPREIGRLLGEPASVVSHRLTTALRQLRARLDRDGGSSSWLGAVAPLCVGVREGSGIGAGVLVLNSKWLTGVLVVALGAAAWMYWDRSAGPSANENEFVAQSAARPDSVASNPSSPASAESPTRASVAPATPRTTASTPATSLTAATRTVRGRVLSADGGELSGIVVSVRGLSASATSALGGWFELDVAQDSGSIECVDPRWITVSVGEFSLASNATPIVLVASSVELAGEVVDSAGDALSGARVTWERPRGFYARFDVDLEGAQDISFRRETDARGRFEFTRAPSIDGAVLRVSLDGFAVHEEPAPSESMRDLRIVLTRPALQVKGRIAGVVLTPDRRPAARARVALGLTSAPCDSDGRFELDLARAVTSDELRAVKEGFLPAVLERPFEPRDGDGGWPAHVEVILPAPALALRGVLLDHERRPVAGARISLADPTHFGVLGRMPASLEGLAAGARVPPEALESERQLPETDGEGFWDYTSPPAPPSALWNWVRSDSEGRFELPGLLDRRYRLRVQPADSLRIFVSDPVDPRDERVEVVMPAAEMWPVVAGRLLGPDGAPVVGASLRLQVEAFGVRSRVLGGTVYISMREDGASARTDGDGRFEFENVPRGELRVSVRGDGLIPSELLIGAPEDPLAIELEAELRCNFELELADPVGRADSICAYDARGERVDLLLIRGGSIHALTFVELVDGRSGVTSVSSRARSLALLKDGEEVARVPVRLGAGKTTTLRW